MEFSTGHMELNLLGALYIIFLKHVVFLEDREADVFNFFCGVANEPV